MEDDRPRRTGTFWTASAHISLAMVGPVVLSVAWDFAHLGWIAGPAAMCLISLACYYTSRLLCDCYGTGHPASGDDEPNYTYADAIRSSGIPNSEVKAKACAFIQYLTLFGRAINAAVGGFVSMAAIKYMNCIHESNEEECYIVSIPYAIIFGITEILLSQIPDFDGIWWVSIVSVVMFFTYSLIGLGLAIARVAAGGSDESNEAVTGTQKIWMSFQALGDIASAYSFSEILIEIQDTIGSSNSKTTMKNATLLSTVVITTFYMLWGCVGYAALGDSTPKDLTDFTFYGPSWLFYIANAAFLINVVGVYQMCSQPIFAFVEEQAASKWPHTRDREIPLPCLGHYKMNLFRLVWRTVFVILTTVISVAFPFVNVVVEIITLGFWPLAVYFPVAMYIKQKQIERWSLTWVCLQMLSMACLAISIMATVASIAELKDDLKYYGPSR
ncbi:hypothetical protein EUGRSUZ_H05096 [Eucalyptus grandis]|uniref:Amino acid transporter transmembrane domain-containing protein n=3 Tax=Eucalyptus grandis TaxID=71139 RepID=A0A059B9Y7_EUCGR|nr:hypothetical protein EUGRSUZ_H05096 [Eucalyptus grandis]KAK3419359.1 hypothetical protein EUGRSUZ_H05096 [Eucalyptus grandis]